MQGLVERAGVRGRFDDVVGVGWRLVTAGDVRVDADVAAWFAGIGGVVVAVGADDGVTDVEGTYTRWFEEHDVVAALQRPDFSLFGTARAGAGATGLLDALRHQLETA